MPGWVVAGKLLAYGSVLVPFVALGLAEQRRLFRIRRALRVRLEDAEPGRLVFVRGRIVESDGAMTAPISGVDCVAWRIGVKVSHDSQTKFHSRSCELVVDDGSGRVLVPALESSANLMLDLSNYHHRVSGRAPLAPAIRRFLQKHRYWSKSGAHKRPCDIHEGILSHGSEVVVVGVLRSRTQEHQTRGHYRTSAQQPRRELAFDSKRLIITNLPRFLATDR